MFFLCCSKNYHSLKTSNLFSFFKLSICSTSFSWNGTRNKKNNNLFFLYWNTPYHYNDNNCILLSDFCRLKIECKLNYLSCFIVAASCYISLKSWFNLSSSCFSFCFHIYLQMLHNNWSLILLSKVFLS